MRYVDKIGYKELSDEAQARLDKAPHYNSDDRVRDIIRLVYHGCCSFCESTPEAASFFHIEHFYPKNAGQGFAKYEKDFRNLHYACQRCNTLKSSKHHSRILSPNFYLKRDKWFNTQRGKISRELYYVGHLAYAKEKQPMSRGAETIYLFDLNNFNGSGRSNREYLVESRIRVYNHVYHLVNSAYLLLVEEECFHDEILRTLLVQISLYLAPTQAYASMIIQNFGGTFLKILEIYEMRKTAKKIS